MVSPPSQTSRQGIMESQSWPEYSISIYTYVIYIYVYIPPAFPKNALKPRFGLMLGGVVRKVRFRIHRSIVAEYASFQKQVAPNWA